MISFMPSNRPSTKIWDVVCIGSGTGSLACAATLAKFGRSVLVLESHTRPGGLTHTFSRKKVRWGTGLHYTGWPTAYENDFPVLWELLTRGKAPWLKLPEENDVYLRSDGERFVKRAGRDNYRADLHGAFPRETAAIDRYLTDIKEVNREFLRFAGLQGMPRWLERIGPGWWMGRKFLAADKTPLVAYMDQIGASERLREHLWFTWGNYGGIPSETSLGAFSIPHEFMVDGLWAPAKGSGAIAGAFGQSIQAAGGEVKTGVKVDGFVWHGGKVAGVKAGGETILAKTVISGIGARETYRLLDEPSRPGHAQRLMNMPGSCSILTLYLALDPEALKKLRLTAVNYWVERNSGGLSSTWEDLTKPPPWFVFSLAARFPQEEGYNQELIPAEVFVGVDGAAFDRWRGTRIMKRGPEYQEWKAELTQKVMEQVEATWPGLGAHIRHCEGATPATIESYTGHIRGAAYGLAPNRGRYSDRALRASSGVPGLILTGQDVMTPGVIGAFYGGLAAAGAVLGGDPRRMLAA